MPVVTCLLQGLTDRPLDDLEGATPLQVAKHPTLDAIAATGSVVTADSDGICQSEVALLQLLGIENEEPVAIGPMEASSLGYTLGPTQLAYSVRFVSMGQGVIIDAADELLSDNEGRLFCEMLNALLGRERLHFAHLYGPRAVLITDHPDCMAALGQDDTHPIAAIGKRWEEALPGGEGPLSQLLSPAVEALAAHEVNLLREELEEPLVNGILLNDGGRRPNWSLPHQRRDYASWALATVRPSFVGVARAVGIELLPVEKEVVKFSAVAPLLEMVPKAAAKKECIVLDIPYIWNSTYKGDLLQKIKTIEWVDKNVLQPLVSLCRQDDWSLAITPLTHSDIRAGNVAKGVVPVIQWQPSRGLTSESPTFSESALEGLPSQSLAEAVMAPILS